MKSDTQFGYFPVSAHAIATGFYLTGAGVEHVGANQPYPIPTHPDMYDFNWNAGRILPEYQLVFIFSGRGEFESHATGLVPLRPGTVIFLLPDVWHRYRPDQAKGWADYWISFNGTIPHRWQEAGILSAATAIQPVRRTQVALAALAEILSVAIHTPENSLSASFAALGLLAELISDLTSAGAASALDNEQQAGIHTGDVLIHKALEMIWNHSHRNLSVTLIARRLGVTRRTLERHFKSHHQSALKELTECRISRAKLMLENTHLPIKRIAQAAGFTSPTHMATAFRRELHTTPGKVRKG